MPDKFAFVVVEGQGRSSQSNRDLVRSHCMRGKNRRANSRRSKQLARQAAVAPPSENPLSRTPATDLELVQFAVEVDESSRRVLFKYLAYSASSNFLYPGKRCVDLHVVLDPVHLLSRDGGFVLITLFTTCAIDDFISQQTQTLQTSRYLNNVLSYLKTKLSEQNAYNSDSLLLVVLTLAYISTMFEDFEAVRLHIRGLQQLIRLRGGLEYLKKQPKLYFKIERVELSWCLSTGHRPLFLPSPISWEPFFRGSYPVPYSILGTLSIDIQMWPKLAAIYKDFQYLADLINGNDVNKTVMNANLFQNASHSIQSRLLGLQDMLGSGVAECLRLGMLAVLTTTFRLPVRRMPHVDLASRLRSAFRDVGPAIFESKTILSWVLMMSVIAVFDVGEPWIPVMWNAVAGGVSWYETKRVFQRLIWIACIHDEPGEKAFMQLQQAISGPEPHLWTE